MGISIAAAGIAEPFGGSIEGFASGFGQGLKDVIAYTLKGVLIGSISGAIGSAVYGQNVWKGMGEGALGGAIGVGVALGTEAALTSVGFTGGVNTAKELAEEYVIRAAYFEDDPEPGTPGHSYWEIDDFSIRPYQQNRVEGISLGDMYLPSLPPRLRALPTDFAYKQYLKGMRKAAIRGLMKIHRRLGEHRKLWVAEVKIDKYVYHKGFLGIKFLGGGYKYETTRWVPMSGGKVYEGGFLSRSGLPTYRTFDAALDATRDYCLWSDLGRSDKFNKNWPRF